MSKATDFRVLKTDFSDWKNVFNSDNELELQTCVTGYIKADSSGIINVNKTKDTKDTDAVNIPVLAHTIKHKKLGTFLIDTGLDSSFNKRPGGNFKGLFRKKYFKDKYFQINESLGIDKQINLDEIQGVFLTHMHEHASGAPSINNDVPFIYGKGEKDVNFFPFVYSRFLKGKTNKQILDFNSEEAIEMPILGKCIDLFKDGSLWAISTPGHTKGHTSYLVNSTRGPVLITGDVAIIKRQMTELLEPGSYSKNKTEAKKSLLKLSAFIKEYKDVKVIYGHEVCDSLK